MKGHALRGVAFFQSSKISVQRSVDKDQCSKFKYQIPVNREQRSMNSEQRTKNSVQRSVDKDQCSKFKHQIPVNSEQRSKNNEQ